MLMPHGAGAMAHLVVAIAVWTGYLVLMSVKRVRGITGRRFALAAVALFLLSLGVFAFI